MSGFFSVAVQMDNGEGKMLHLSASSASEAFQKAKATDGVRRVGKISPMTRAEYDDAMGRPRFNGHVEGAPRVVIHARSGERPFAALKPPPPKPKMYYRVYRSRRSDGQPYYLQRGLWDQNGKKKFFRVEWEKGFDQKEGALKHMDWLRGLGETVETVDGH